MCIDGEVTAVGGHTSGFVPTATAEYFSGGEWHQLNTVYPHDQAFCLPMKSGRVLIAGGHEQSLGIGQTFTVELYDPATHTFEGFGCLDRKRCFAEGVDLDSGRVLITGNWFNDDGMELFDGSRQCLSLANVSQHRSEPYVLRTARDNVIVFSNSDYHAEPFDTVIVDRLHGEPFTVPLFETWRPFWTLTPRSSACCFVGDEAIGDYTYFIQVMNKEGQMAFARVGGEQFELLPTTSPVPMSGPWGDIIYFSYVVADRSVKKAYVVGYGKKPADTRFYVLTVDYGVSPAALTLGHTDPQGDVGISQPVLTPEGNLLIVGGVGIDSLSNFKPYRSVTLLHVGQGSTPSCQQSATWPWVAAVVLLLLAAIVGTVLYRRRRQVADHTTLSVDELEPDSELMDCINRLMNEQRLYLNPSLTVNDIAAQLGVHRNAVSQTINAHTGYSFTQLVGRYRVEYAQQLLREHPNMKISSVCTKAGFASETTFFRSFKSVTGMTPSEWASTC